MFNVTVGAMCLGVANLMYQKHKETGRDFFAVMGPINFVLGVIHIAIGISSL